jgi:single-stranded-DNA-specific exonuclease
MGSNIDLAGLALTGAVGDKQRMDGPNSEILEKALEAGVISVKTGLKVPDGPVEDVLLTLTEPYLDTSGDKAGTETFLREIRVSGPIQDMEAEDLGRLSSAMALKIAGSAEPTVVSSMVGDVLILEKEVVPNIYTMEWMLNCCGKVNRADLGLSLCLRDAGVLDEALSLSVKYQKTIVENIREAEAMIREMGNIRYVALEDNAGTGIIASTLIRYVCPDKPFITLNKVDDLVKVSARGTRKLVDRGLDLAVAMREAAQAAGGQGGGHNIASGAGIPVGSEEGFLAAVDRIVGGQLT